MRQPITASLCLLCFALACGTDPPASAADARQPDASDASDAEFVSDATHDTSRDTHPPTSDAVDAPAIDTADAPSETRFTLATYNVAGLPEGISGSHPLVNTPLISPLLEAFELALVQEDFTYHAALAASTTHAYGYEPGPIAFTRVSSDGLAAFSRFPLSPPERHLWRSCSGLLDKKNDCLASKGFTFTELTLPGGTVIGVYNLHMDAGRDDEDAAARADQAEQLIEHMLLRPDQALIVAGDTNLRSVSDSRDVPIFERLLVAGAFEDACTASACDDLDRLDKVLYRSSAQLELTLESYAIDPRFFDGDGAPLSDHEPVVVTLEAHRLP